ncbi:UNVERIFIED_CONTAM: hypothetical protein Sangu_1532800 [Sesamum angustifolium]|uniref:Uncharacterized protein n=1 Tax=Sesamum angustifolium TaxID=2727405 RepID=A0AAW2MRS2_9LAMI
MRKITAVIGIMARERREGKGKAKGKETDAGAGMVMMTGIGTGIEMRGTGKMGTMKIGRRGWAIWGARAVQSLQREGFEGNGCRMFCSA